MIPNINPAPATPDPALERSPLAPAPSPAAPPAAQPDAAASPGGSQTPPAASGSADGAAAPFVQSPPDLQLTIDMNDSNTGFVYKVVDRLTGQTVSEFPREQLAKLGESESYAAGSVVNTNV